MKLGGKEVSFYWPIIKIPTFILIGWSIIGLIIALINFGWYSTIFLSPYTGIILIVAIFGFIGWSAIKDHKLTIKEAVWAGVLCGVIVGFVGAILSILMINLVPELIQYSFNQVAAQGSPVSFDQMKQVMTIGAYIGIITSPIMNAIIAAIITSISALIASKVK